MVLEKTSESPLDSKEITPINLKGKESWIVIGRTDAEAEAPVFWSPDKNSWFTGKVTDARKDWGQRRRGHQRMRWLEGIAYAIDMNLANSGRCEGQEAWCPTLYGITKSRAWLGTEQVYICQSYFAICLILPFPHRVLSVIDCWGNWADRATGQVLYSGCLILKSTPFTTPFLPLCRLLISPLWSSNQFICLPC